MTSELPIEYRADRKLTPGEFVDLLQRSRLAERRPVDDADTIKSMVEHANLTVTAWDEDKLIGVARSLTDFAYCCYLSDLAVDVDYQQRGIGRELIRVTQQQLAPACKLILLAAPTAAGYYPKLGFERHDSAWIIRADTPLT